MSMSVSAFAKKTKIMIIEKKLYQDYIKIEVLKL